MKKPKPKRLLPVSVAVLMGGESRRFGSPKAFLKYKRKSLAAHVLVQAGRYSTEVFAVSRTLDQVPPDARKAFPIVLDQWKQKGPLAGLHSALRHSSQPAVFMRGVDMPFLKGRVLKSFWAMFREADWPDVIAPRINQRWEPLCALWNRELFARLRPGNWHSFQELLNEGKLKIRMVTEKELKRLDPSFDCLRNFNTPQEWKKISSSNRIR